MLYVCLHDTISPVVRGVDPAQVSQAIAIFPGGPSILHEKVENLCNQILRLMECSSEQETEEVIQAGFELWKEVLHFTYPEGIIYIYLCYCVLYIYVLLWQQ